MRAQEWSDMEFTQATETNGHQTGFKLPEDLSNLLEKRTLVSLVLREVGEVSDEELQRVAGALKMG